MRTTRAHFQQGSIRREKRKQGPAVWTLRWREMTHGGTKRRKAVIGTVEKLPTKAAAWKACEHLRSTINQETSTPRTVAELVTHYTEKELPNKTPYTREVYRGYISKWLLPMWGRLSLSDVKAVAFESWLGTLALANGSKAKLRNIFSAIYSHGMRWEFTDRNPISLVRQSAKRQHAPSVLDVEEIRSAADGTDRYVSRHGVCSCNYWAASLRAAQRDNGFRRLRVIDNLPGRRFVAGRRDCGFAVGKNSLGSNRNRGAFLRRRIRRYQDRCWTQEHSARFARNLAGCFGCGLAAVKTSQPR